MGVLAGSGITGAFHKGIPRHSRKGVTGSGERGGRTPGIRPVRCSLKVLPQLQNPSCRSWTVPFAFANPRELCRSRANFTANGSEHETKITLLFDWRAKAQTRSSDHLHTWAQQGQGCSTGGYGPRYATEHGGTPTGSSAQGEAQPRGQGRTGTGGRRLPGTPLRDSGGALNSQGG